MAGDFDDPQVETRNVMPRFEHPTDGRVTMRGIALDLSYSRPSIRRPPPRLGEHTTEVLRELGYDASDVPALETVGAI